MYAMPRAETDGHYFIDAGDPGLPLPHINVCLASDPASHLPLPRLAHEMYIPQVSSTGGGLSRAKSRARS